MVLNLWVLSLLRVTYHLSCIPDIYVMIHNITKLQLWVSNEIVLWLKSPQREELLWVTVLEKWRTTTLAHPKIGATVLPWT